MAKRKGANNTKTKIISAIIVAVIVFLCAAFEQSGLFDMLKEKVGIASVTADVSGKIIVHFIDIGQGDSALIMTSDMNILIDGGEKGKGDTVISYLKEKGVSELDYIIATHPHSDHIGGLVDVMDSLTYRNIIIPELTQINIPTTKLYKAFLEKISVDDVNVIVSEPGKVIEKGDTKITLLGPVKQDSDLNNMSVIAKITYGNNSFMFTGDMEHTEEQTILDNTKQSVLSCDVLKLGHHGSKTSTSDDFLECVNPKFAVVSCGRDNDYGHPHKEIVTKLNEKGIEYFRTDLQGSIVFEGNGKTVVRREAA